MYVATAPAALHPLYAAGMALLYALLIAATRTWLLERHYRVRAPAVGCTPWAVLLLCRTLSFLLRCVLASTSLLVRTSWVELFAVPAH